MDYEDRSKPEPESEKEKETLTDTPEIRKLVVDELVRRSNLAADALGRLWLAFHHYKDCLLINSSYITDGNTKLFRAVQIAPELALWQSFKDFEQQYRLLKALTLEDFCAGMIDVKAALNSQFARGLEEDDEKK